MRAILFLVLAVLLAAAAAGCGGESDAEKAQEPASADAAAVCDGTALAGDTGLPASFPKPASMVFVTSEQAGPSRLVDGYFDGELDEAFDAWKQAFEGAGYDVTKDEQEQDDAEVFYAGGGRTGQVALREECGREGRIFVHITSRPE